MRKTYLSVFISILLVLCTILPASAADPVPVESITLDPASAVISVGKTLNVKATIAPKNATAKKPDWTSSDETVATVQNGKVKGIAPGTATITAKATDDSGTTATLEVTVVQPVKKITADNPKLVLAPGTTWKPDITIEPADATIQKLTWTSSNDKVANVDETGEISAAAVGKASITGTATDDSKQKVTISVQVTEHEVTILTPNEVNVSFDTRPSAYSSRLQIGSFVREESEETTITFKNGLVCEGSAEHKLRPLKPGSGSVEIVTKHNGKKVTRKESHSVFVAQSAVPTESDKEIGRLEAESYEGHTYQIFCSSRSWDDAKAFCEKHGGHLATITSDKEQKFLERYLAKAEKKESYWIGLDSGKSKKFSKWITGEAISYTKWSDGNPDGNEPSHNCGRMAASEYADNNNWTMGRGTWDDVDANYYWINGFICEWDEENSPNALPVTTASDETDTAETPEMPESITLQGGQENAWSQSLTLNAGKDTEYTFIGYFLPAGTYTATNMDDNSAVQITVYRNVRRTVDGVEEFTTDPDKKPLLLFPGKSKELTLDDNEFIKLSDDAGTVLIEKAK